MASATPGDVELVAHMCKTFPEIHGTLEDTAKRIASETGRHVSLAVQCACGPAPFCTYVSPKDAGPVLSHLQHLASNYDQLKRLTIFVNARVERDGVAAHWYRSYGRKVFEAVIRDVVGAQGDLSSFWSDGKGIALRKAKRRVFGFAGHVSTRPAALTGDQRTNETTAYCKSGARCSLLPFFPCKERCECEPQTSCRRVTITDSVDLRPARPPSFMDWATMHWELSAFAVDACRWHWGSTFAVGSDLVRRWPREQFVAAQQHLVSGGLGGGMAAVYMERLWRGIFFCSAGGEITQKGSRLQAP